MEDMTNERLLVTLEMSGWIERSTVARTIQLLIEVEKRKLDIELSYTSMYDFCLRRLRFSEGEAVRRLACARLAASFPVILEPLRDGSVTLTNIVLLRDIFTTENVDALLAEIANKTKREVEAIVARLQPKPDVPDSVQLIDVQPTLVVPAPAAMTTMPSQPALEKATTRPLSEDRYAVSFTAPGAFFEKVRRVCELTHRPMGDGLADILGLSLDAYIAQLEKKMLGKGMRARKAKPSKDPGYISTAVRRDVRTRDDGQCTFVSAEGMRCPAREHLELDHRQPRARGGSGEASNARLLCARHNRHEAEKAFGREHIERSIQTAQAKRRVRREASTTMTSTGNLEPQTPPVAERETSLTARAAVQPSIANGVSAIASTTSFTVPTALPREAATPPDEAQALDDHEKKRVELRYALVEDQGFKSADVDRLIASMTTDQATWSRPLGAVFVEALRRLTSKAPSMSSRRR